MKNKVNRGEKKNLLPVKGLSLRQHLENTQTFYQIPHIFYDNYQFFSEKG